MNIKIIIEDNGEIWKGSSSTFEGAEMELDRLKRCYLEDLKFAEEAENDKEEFVQQSRGTNN